MLGDILLKLRNQRKLTQEQLANQLGISRGTYAHYEINKRQPDYDMLQRIADYFDVSTDFLLGRVNNPNSKNSKVTVAGKEIELTKEEFEVFNEIRKHPIAFHDLASDPKRKVKQLIKMWEFIKKDLNDDEDEGEGFGKLED